MFYSTQILAKKGPLGTVWLAAHMDQRLKKNSVFEANIAGSVGQLLLGVVNIYKRKVNYLYEDCTDAVSKLQQAFKPVTLTLPGDGKAPAMQITLPEDFNLSHLHGLFEEIEEDEGPYDFSQGLQLHLSTKDSMYLADDATQLFRTPSSFRDEEFEIAGDEVEEHLSMEPPEKLREAVVPTAQRLFETVMASPSMKGDEMMPDVDMDEMEMMAPPSAPPSSARLSDGGFDDALTPLDMGDDPVPYNVQVPELELEDSPGKRKDRDEPRPAKQRARGGQKRQRVVRDVDAEGRPATVLATSEIRKLLADRQPLLREPHRLSKSDIAASACERQAKHHGLASSGPSWTTEAGVSNSLAPALQQLFPFEQTGRASRAEEAPSEHEQVNRGGDMENAADHAAPEASPPRPQAGDEEAHHDTYEPPHFEGGEGGTPYNDDPGNHGTDHDDDAGEAALSPPPSSAPSGRRQPTQTPASAQPSIGRDSSSRKRRELGEELAAVEEEEYDYAAKDSFTARSKLVLKQVKSKLSGKVGSKKQRLSGKATETVGFEELHGSGDRTEAARLFFELLVLQTRQQVTLSQTEPFGDIVVAAR